jgi:dihydroxyacid dehydratase/phosphogluconate dehydratase
VLEFGKIVKKGIEKQKMLAWQYNAVGVSDAITMGGEGRSAYSERTPLYPLSLTSC